MLARLLQCLIQPGLRHGFQIHIGFARGNDTLRAESGQAFVELTSPVMGLAKQCRLELDNGSGATMRVELVGYDAADVEALSRGFWNAL